MLSPCSINKIQRPWKAQSKNRKSDEETSVSRRFYLFCQVLRPCSIEHILIMKLLHWVAFLYGFYPNLKLALWFLESFFIEVLSVTILETTKTYFKPLLWALEFYRSQFWRLQKLEAKAPSIVRCFIGHNFGDHKNSCQCDLLYLWVLSVIILETTKTASAFGEIAKQFYRSQF